MLFKIYKIRQFFVIGVKLEIYVCLKIIITNIISYVLLFSLIFCKQGANRAFCDSNCRMCMNTR